MDKNLARRLVNMVNGHNDVIIEYANARIETLRGLLEQTKTLEDLNFLKGQIREARDLLKLRERVLSTLGAN